MWNQAKLTGVALTAALALAGCDRKDGVEHEIQDLKQAEQNTPKQAQELQQELDKAKGEVVQLEEKLALAKQGVTDEVVKERDELQRAVKDENTHVRNEIAQAQNQANELNAATQKAQAELQRVPTAERAQTQLKTETKVIPSERQVGVETQQQQVPINQQQLVERPAEKQPVKTTGSTTTGKTMQAEGN
jgi:chromosome segregation ATPase